MWGELAPPDPPGPDPPGHPLWVPRTPPAVPQGPARLLLTGIRPLTEVEDPEAVQGIIAGQGAQERDPAAVGGHGEAARLAEREATSPGVLAGERRRHGHRRYSTW
jgi:hypothetical protein